MPCRSRAALTAAQSVQCLWITDEVLGEALQRFIRVSHASRRHGSSVPGPLEARRRLAKRRMGVAAVASGNAPPAGDWGALFGVGTRPPGDLKKAWRWEAPASQIPLGAGRTPPAPPGWLWPTVGSESALWKGKIEREDERVAQFLEIPEDPLESSRLAFEDLLNTRQQRTTLSVQDVEPMLDFLQSSANEPEARLTLRLVQWLGQAKWMGDLAFNIECLRSLLNVIQEKIKLLTINRDEVSEILIQLLQHEEAKTIMLSIVDTLTSDYTSYVLPRATEQILATQTSRSDQRASVDRWLACLRSCSFSKGQSHCANVYWQTIYPVLAKHFRPSELAAHFSMLIWEDFAMLLLRYWVSGFTTATSRMDLDAENRNADLEVLHRGSHKSLRHYPSRDSFVDLVAIEADFKFVRSKRFHQYALDPKKALTDLVAVLARRKVQYAELLGEIFSIYQQTQSPERVRNLFCDLHNNRWCGIPPELATMLVQSFLSSGHLKYAFLVFDLVPSVPLSQCYELPLRLIDTGTVSVGKAISMLNRIPPADIQPFELRNKPKNTLKQEHVDLVHLVAYACAKSAHITNRVAFRRVWECYRFLHDRGAPLSPLMSRAFVKAGLSRPLNEGERVSATKIRYVLGIVEGLEGRGVAGRIDELVYVYWQRHWRSFLEAGFKREEGKMERDLRWRMKVWTKRGSARWYSNAKPAEGEGVETEDAAHNVPRRKHFITTPTTIPRTEFVNERSFGVNEATCDPSCLPESQASTPADTIPSFTDTLARTSMTEQMKASDIVTVDVNGSREVLAEGRTQDDEDIDFLETVQFVPFEDADEVVTSTTKQNEASESKTGDNIDHEILAKFTRDEEVHILDKPQVGFSLHLDGSFVEVRTKPSTNSGEVSRRDSSEAGEESGERPSLPPRARRDSRQMPSLRVGGTNEPSLQNCDQRRPKILLGDAMKDPLSAFKKVLLPSSTIRVVRLNGLGLEKVLGASGPQEGGR